MDDQVVINQHYVPQSYLKRFASPEGGIFVLDKPLDKVFKQGINNVAYEKYFYDLPEDAARHVGDVQYLEKRFCQIEGKFVKAVDDLLHDVSVGKPMHVKQQADLAYFLLIQDLRTAYRRDVQTEMLQKVINSGIERQLELKQFDISALEVSVKVEDELALALQARFIFNPPDVDILIAPLLKHKWLVGINETPAALFTSDNPVAVRPHAKHPFRSMSGFSSRGVEIAYPLSPKCILLLFEREHHTDLSSRLYEHIILDEDDVAYYNEMQVEQSRRQVYGKSDEFKVAQKLCDDYPELRNVNRAKVTVNEMSMDGNEIIHIKNVESFLRRPRRFQY